MSYKTLEVELENGHVRPCGAEVLPANAHALLTLLDSASRPAPAKTCFELAQSWSGFSRLPADEASAFADDIERGRINLPRLKPAWD